MGRTANSSGKVDAMDSVFRKCASRPSRDLDSIPSPPLPHKASVSPPNTVFGARDSCFSVLAVLKWVPCVWLKSVSVYFMLYCLVWLAQQAGGRERGPNRPLYTQQPHWYVGRRKLLETLETIKTHCIIAQCCAPFPLSGSI